MSVESIEANDTPQITETVAQPEQNKTKSYWYTMLKQDPEAYAKHKEMRKQKYEENKLFRQLNNIEKPTVKKPYTYKPTPEKKHEYNVKYYKTHKDKVDQYLKDYRKKEMAKESSTFIKFINEWQNKRYHEVTKNTPEAMEKRRIYAREYYNKKKLEKQQAAQQ